MIPLRLRLAGFLSYREPVELDFTGFDLACISGSNGSGKSSLLDAITWALFGQARRRDDALVNSASNAAEVTLDFAYEGNVYSVRRCIFSASQSKKPSELEFFVQVQPGDGGAPEWKPLTERTQRESEARIQQVLRMDYETFVNASFFLQGKADQFAQQRPGDRKRILSNILGLDEWEVYRERASERRKALENEVAGIEGQLREIDAELAEEPGRRERLKELESELKRLKKARSAQEASLEGLRRLAASLAERRKLVEALQGALAAAEARRDELAARRAERATERDAFRAEAARAEEIEAGYRAWQAARTELEAWEGVAARYREYNQQRNAPLMQIAAERSALEREAQTLSEQARKVSAARGEAPGWEEKLGAAQADLEAAVARIQQRAERGEALRDLHRQQAEARAENPRLKAEMDDLKARIDQLEAASGAACPTCGQPLGEDERRELILELNGQGKAMADRYRANRELLKDFENRVAALEAEIRVLEAADEDERRASRAIEQARARLDQIAAQVQEWEAGGAPRLAAIEAILQEERYAPEARATLEEVDMQLKSIGYDAAAHDAVRRAEQAGRGAEEELRRLETARARLAPLEREIAGLEGELATQVEEIARREAEAGEAAAAYAAEQAGLPDLDQVERELFALVEQENRLRMELGAAAQKVRVLDDLRERQAGLHAAREEQARVIARLKTLERAFGKDGVPALLIEQALPEIESTANEVLDRLSGGRMMVSFVTLRGYRDKKREDQRETLDIVISDGGRGREYELFSGGEAFRVNFAIRLALAKVLARRAGARLQTLVVDEGFGNQDAEGRQRLVEAINLVQPDFAKILVITHLEELKDAFPTRIEVEKTERGSALRVM